MQDAPNPGLKPPKLDLHAGKVCVLRGKATAFFTPQPPLLPPMTRNRLTVANLSGCVQKILALQSMSKIDFLPQFLIRQMHSFPIMYNTMGSKVESLAVRDHFFSKIA